MQQKTTIRIKLNGVIARVIPETGKSLTPSETWNRINGSRIPAERCQRIPKFVSIKIDILSRSPYHWSTQGIIMLQSYFQFSDHLSSDLQGLLAYLEFSGENYEKTARSDWLAPLALHFLGIWLKSCWWSLILNTLFLFYYFIYYYFLQFSLAFWVTIITFNNIKHSDSMQIWITMKAWEKQSKWR